MMWKDVCQKINSRRKVGAHIFRTGINNTCILAGGDSLIFQCDWQRMSHQVVIEPIVSPEVYLVQFNQRNNWMCPIENNEAFIVSIHHSICIRISSMLPRKLTQRESCDKHRDVENRYWCKIAAKCQTTEKSLFAQRQIHSDEFSYACENLGKINKFNLISVRDFKIISQRAHTSTDNRIGGILNNESFNFEVIACLQTHSHMLKIP